MESPAVPHIDLTVSFENFEEDARKIIQLVRPNWDLDTLKFKTFTEGITNKLLGCYEPGQFDQLVLIRVNGAGSAILIDRDGEREILAAMFKAECAPPVYATFNNGMAYGFFPGEPLDEKTVREPHIQRLIAEEMVRLHKINLPSVEKSSNGKPVSQYGTRMHKWLDAAPASFDNPAKQEVFEREIPSIAELRKELDVLVSVLDDLQMDVVFSHNDLLLKNIVYNEKQGTIRFIDYEYSFYNYEAFDIGNHFTEYAGMDEVDYNLYPSREYQLVWLRHFLSARNQGSEVTDVDVERLYVQVNKCACAAHFLWGLWALIQAAHSTIDFDYVRYASIRLKEYFRRKEEFFSLKLPA